MKTPIKIILFLFLFIGTINSCKQKDITPKQVEFSEVKATDITEFGIKLSSSIISSGNSEIKDHGFALSLKTENPELDDSGIKLGGIEPAVPTPIVFSASLNNLETNTDYFVRPFAVTSSKTWYGKSIKFKTAMISQPVIKTLTAEKITYDFAELNAKIESKGTYPIQEYGMIWDIKTNPTTQLNTKISIKNTPTKFPLNFSAESKNLSSNTEYFFRAYIIANNEVFYGETQRFTTAAIVQPSVSTENASDISFNHANLSGAVKSAGTFPITEYGIVWAETQNPTTKDAKANIKNNINVFPQNYTLNATNLKINTNYYYRAYVIANNVITYGENKSFKTLIENPIVETGEAFSIAGRGHVFSGTVQSAGSYPITEMGIVYGSNNDPTVKDNKQSISGNGISYPHNFSFNITSLPANLTYYRAFAISNGSVFYGKSKDYKIVKKPVIETGTHEFLQSESNVKLTAVIQSDGDPKIIEYGVVWSINKTPPTINHEKESLIVNLILPLRPPTVKTFKVPYSKLPNCSTIYYRTYVITADDQVQYSGSTKSFSTGNCPIK